MIKRVTTREYRALTKPIAQQQWEKELKNPKDEDIDYVAEKDISKQDIMINNLAVALGDIPGLDQDNAVYSSEDKIQAVTAYFIHGSISKAAKVVDIHPATLRKWKQQSPWWNTAVREIKRAKQEQLDSKLTNLIEKSMSELRERLMNGDEVVISGGTKVRKKITARDLAVITNMLYDKRTALRKDPLSEEKTPDGDDTIKKLKHDFEKLSREINAKTIEGEVLNE